MTDPSTLIRPDAGRLRALADRLDIEGRADLAAVVRNAAVGLGEPSAPLDEVHRLPLGRSR